MWRDTKKDISSFNSLPSGRLFSSLILNYIDLPLREEKMTSHSSTFSKRIHEATQNGLGHKYPLS